MRSWLLICLCGRQFHDNIWEVGLVIVLLFSSVSSIASQDTTGFISIDCGGEGATDKFVPGLQWVTDENFLDSGEQLNREGVAIRASVALNDTPAAVATRDNADQLNTAMVFLPGLAARSKYCYTFQMPTAETINTTSYLIRAMFPSRSLKAMDPEVDLTIYGTRFYFTLDSTVITLVDLDKEQTQTIELVVNPLDYLMFICLVPLEDRSSMAAISSLEVRPLSDYWYPRGNAPGNAPSTIKNGQDAKSKRTTYLITVSRLNFGGNVSSRSLRFPDDGGDPDHEGGDRLWYPAEVPQYMALEVKTRKSTVQGGVWGTAWEGSNLSSNLSFTIDISAAQAERSMRSFYLQMFFFDVVNYPHSTGRFVNISRETRGPAGYFDNVWWTWDFEVGNTPFNLFNSQENLSGDSVTFRIIANASSTLPPMINGADIMGEFDALTQRTLETDASIVRKFSQAFTDKSTVDTSGDPCLPVPWAWLACSIDATPRITEINLTSKSIKGSLVEDFGSLDRLTVLDLSNNSFSGELPESLKNIVSLRAVKLDYNNLSGDLPDFSEKTLINLESLSLGHNKLGGNLSSLIQALDTPVFSLNLTDNKFIGPIPPEIKELENLKYLDLSFNQLSGALPPELFQLSGLEILNLKGNKLTDVGDLWSHINKSSGLRELNLELNSLGELNLTSWFQMSKGNGSTSAYAELRVSFLGSNISNVIRPSQDDLDIKRFCTSSRMSILLGQTPWCSNLKLSDRSQLERYLCRTSVTDREFCNSSGNGFSRRALIIGLTVSGFLVLVLSCVLAFLLGRMLKRMKDLRQIQEALAKEDVRPPFYDYDELRAATKDFASENELGKGAFGAVYKATLADTSVVAVKLLFHTDQNISDFLKEMVLITGIKHKNLVQLKGCCIRDKKRMLVYEYAENGNLAQSLWGNHRSTVLTWEQRLKISVGIAKGLSYLHEELQPKIIHRDIKPQNILLDKDWNPKIADFGLARPLLDNSTQRATSIAGTMGYFSPEYATQGLLTEKLDVYSYGVLLLEIVTGRKCIGDIGVVPTEEIYLKDWAFRAYRENCLSRIAAESILASVSTTEIESLLKTALLCLQHDHEKRPSMSQVVTMLTGNAADVAVDIVSELKDLQRLYEDPQSRNGKVTSTEREDRALLGWTSLSSDAQGFIELNVSRAR
ncbi:hypothetical protein R1sor_013088 [Riccia sorocarpa]|uniref:non-specific serine/threonine protein kinase n=1 Tax=Riccia sorocarpa TaxID=122646 RepID=A0ABD3HBL7_9MARC